MSGNGNGNKEEPNLQQTPDIERLKQNVKEIAESCQGDTLALLALLRTLEEVHVQVRDDLFQPSLPNNRQKLYALLRDIEVDGGWPYIPRMKIRRLMANFDEEIGNLLHHPKHQ